MGIPGIGQVLRVQPVHAMYPDARIYKTRVADIKEGEYLALEIPMDEETGKPGLFIINTELKLWYQDTDGKQVMFQARIIGKKQENIRMLLVEYPAPESIQKIQRRNFLRVEASVEIAVKLEGPRNVHVLARTIDIGGGGISFSCPDHYPFQVGDPLQIWLVLPLRSGLSHAKAKGEVVRITAPQEKGYYQRISVKFTDIKEKERQKIMRFCYERQLELHKKGF